MMDAALLDIDGTLIDDNLLHVLAWRRAFERVGKEVPASAILYKIGMGGDKLAPAILGEDGEAARKARAYHGEEYLKSGLIQHSRPLPGAIALLRALREHGVRIALASSAKPEEVDYYLELLGGRDLVDEVVTAAEVEETKPAPDLFRRALDALGWPGKAVVIGDTVYDVHAAQRVGLPCVAVLTGGIDRATLQEAGAAVVVESAATIAADLDPILRRAAHA